MSTTSNHYRRTLVNYLPHSKPFPRSEKFLPAVALVMPGIVSLRAHTLSQSSFLTASETVGLNLTRTSGSLVRRYECKWLDGATPCTYRRE
jgi:hypothetical protein